MQRISNALDLLGEFQLKCCTSIEMHIYLEHEIMNDLSAKLLGNFQS